MKTSVLIGVVSSMWLFAVAAAPAAAQNWVEAPGSPHAAVIFPQAMAITPRGEFLYVLNSVPSDANSVSAYRITTDNTLSEISGSGFFCKSGHADTRPVPIPSFHIPTFPIWVTS